MKRIAVAVLAILLLMIPLTSCGERKISVPTYVIYKASDGECYSVTVRPQEYEHSICGIHSFTEKPLKSFQGYTVTCEKEEEDAEEENEEGFEIQEVEDAETVNNRPVKIYTKDAIQNRLTVAILFSEYSYSAGIEEKTSAQNQLDRIYETFSENGSVDETISVIFDGNAVRYHIVVKLETFKYVKTVYTEYSFEGNMTKYEEPYYDENGKKVGSVVSVVSDFSSATYFDYK